MSNSRDDGHNLAVFVDFENLALGFQDRQGVVPSFRVRWPTRSRVGASTFSSFFP